MCMYIYILRSAACPLRYDRPVAAEALRRASNDPNAALESLALPSGIEALALAVFQRSARKAKSKRVKEKRGKEKRGKEKGGKETGGKERGGKQAKGVEGLVGMGFGRGAAEAALLAAGGDVAKAVCALSAFVAGDANAAGAPGTAAAKPAVRSNPFRRIYRGVGYSQI